MTVGSKVTIHYKMSADSIEVRDPATKAPSTDNADKAAERAEKRAKK